MSSPEIGQVAAPASAAPSPALLTVIAFATGGLVANLYYSQPLIGVIGPELGIRPDIAGAVVSVTQIGYGIGLFLFVSLADLVENKKLVLIALVGTILALIGAALSPTAAIFFIASFIIGVCSTGAQVLVPYTIHMVPEANRGRVVGNVMAGLLTGILLARPFSLFVSASLGWRSVFWISAGLMLLIGVLLMRMMPKFQPRGGMSYGKILRSMFGLLVNTPVLRRRAAYQGLMFCAFNVFWTAAPLMLAERFGLNQQGVALFALAGAGGALAAPLAGRLADRGLVRGATFGAMAVLTLSFFGSNWAVGATAMAALVVLTLLIDAAVQTNQVVSQRVIFSLPGEVRGRVNAIYMTTAFFGGAIGSTLATTTYHAGGWSATATAGGLIGVIALLIFATDRGAKA
ncbi:MAG TPA: MFS transporter [Arsenicitalea sp.]|jgi:predicted MFS family arabinose efflux permease|nr:MFS transporter [Arsenicitalea sp.]